MKKQSSFQQTPPFDLRPASVEEAGLFYSNDERDEALGTVGHLRMDFGSGGKGFYPEPPRFRRRHLAGSGRGRRGLAGRVRLPLYRL